jgi:hypothetical protein
MNKQPSRWAAKLKSTSLWQAAFVRPFEDRANWKAGMAALLSYTFGFVLVVTSGPLLIDDALSWPVPLEEMQQTTGVIVSAGKESTGGGGRGGGAPGSIGYVVVSTSKGKETFYATTKVKVLLNHRVGQAVTVWWQPSFRFQTWKVGIIKQASEIYVKDANWYALKYSELRSTLIEFDSKDLRWYWSMLAFGLFLLVRPAWKHRKKNEVQAGFIQAQ